MVKVPLTLLAPTIPPTPYLTYSAEEHPAETVPVLAHFSIVTFSAGFGVRLSSPPKMPPAIGITLDISLFPVIAALFVQFVILPATLPDPCALPTMPPRKFDFASTVPVFLQSVTLAVSTVHVSVPTIPPLRGLCPEITPSFVQFFTVPPLIPTMPPAAYSTNEPACPSMRPLFVQLSIIEEELSLCPTIPPIGPVVPETLPLKEQFFTVPTFLPTTPPAHEYRSPLEMIFP